MQTPDIQTDQDRFSQLVEAVEGGETIIIAEAGIPCIDRPRRRGMLEHVSFDAEASAAADADIAESFEGINTRHPEP